MLVHIIGRWRSLFLPFAVGLASVVLPILMVEAGQSSGNQLEGALFLMGLLGIGASLVTFPWTVFAAMAAQRRDRRNALEFVVALAVATLPTAWLQCLNGPASIMGVFWGWFHKIPDEWSAEHAWADMRIWNSGTYALFFLIVSYFAHRFSTAKDELSRR